MFADRIKELRTRNELTQKEFSERVGISPTTLISYEKGGKVPSYEILVNIANEFNISLDWLCEIEKTTSWKKTTAVDIVNVLSKLFDIFPCSTIHASTEFDVPEDAAVFIGLYYVEPQLLKFCNELGDMRKLMMKGTIKKELFDLWYDNKVTELGNIPAIRTEYNNADD